MNNSTTLRVPLIRGHNDPGVRDKQDDDRHESFDIDVKDKGAAARKASIAVVADGVTSTGGGNQASDLAVRMIRSILRQQDPAKNLLERLEEAVIGANREIWSQAQSSENNQRMSTTLVLAAIDGHKLHILHVGDSRAYLVRDNQIYLLTLDHTWVQQALDVGYLDEEKAKTHANRHVIQRYLGINPTVDIDKSIVAPGNYESAEEREFAPDNTLDLQEEDILLLCTDGLTERVQADELRETLSAYRGRPRAAAMALVQIALDRQETDNITALVIDFSSQQALAALDKSSDEPNISTTAITTAGGETSRDKTTKNKPNTGKSSTSAMATTLLHKNRQRLAANLRRAGFSSPVGLFVLFSIPVILLLLLWPSTMLTTATVAPEGQPEGSIAVEPPAATSTTTSNTGNTDNTDNTGNTVALAQAASATNAPMPTNTLLPATETPLPTATPLPPTETPRSDINTNRNAAPTSTPVPRDAIPTRLPETPTNTPTPTPTSTNTPTHTPTDMPTLTPTDTPTNTPTPTYTPSHTPTIAPIPSSTPTSTPPSQISPAAPQQLNIEVKEEDNFYVVRSTSSTNTIAALENTLPGEQCIEVVVSREQFSGEQKPAGGKGKCKTEKTLKRDELESGINYITLWQHDPSSGAFLNLLSNYIKVDIGGGSSSGTCPGGLDRDSNGNCPTK